MLALIGAENMLFVLAFGGYTIGWGKAATHTPVGVATRCSARGSGRIRGGGFCLLTEWVV